MSRVHFFFSSRSRQTCWALGTGVQTCALPVSRPETLEDIVRPRAGSDQFRLSRGFEIGAAKAERSLKAAILVENHAGRDQRGPRQMIGEPIGGAPIFAKVQHVRYPRWRR